MPQFPTPLPKTGVHSVHVHLCKHTCKHTCIQQYSELNPRNHVCVLYDPWNQVTFMNHNASFISGHVKFTTVNNTIACQPIKSTPPGARVTRYIYAIHIPQRVRSHPNGTPATRACQAGAWTVVPSTFLQPVSPLVNCPQTYCMRASPL